MSDTKLLNFVTKLVDLSEKGAEIARVFSSIQASIAPTEKDDSNKNPKFREDYKTLADVLVQETLRRELEEFSLQERVYGEEDGLLKDSIGKVWNFRELKTQEQLLEALKFAFYFILFYFIISFLFFFFFLISYFLFLISFLFDSNVNFFLDFF